MVEQLGPKTAIVSVKELGTNCWLTRRFIPGGRCQRVFACKYPEKKTCEAVKTELTYLREHSKQLIDEIKGNTKASIKQLENDLKK